MPKATAITGLLLAGGRGERMGGQDKGLLQLDGQPLAAHGLQRLRPQVGSVAISANRHLDAYAALGCPVWPDPQAPASFDGPLAGMLSGLQHCSTDWLATVPCDAPHLPVDLVARLAEAVQRHGVLLATACTPGPAGEGPRSQPVFSLMHRSLQARLARDLAQGQRRVRQWQAEVGGVEVLFEDARAFANLNTPDDLARLQRS